MATGLYVFGEYIKRLKTLFQQNKVNVSFRETVCLIAKNPSHNISNDPSPNTISSQCYKKLNCVISRTCKATYSRCSRISNTSCLPKRHRQTGQTQIRIF